MTETKPFKKLTYRTAIIAKCRQCSITTKEVKKCLDTDCALYPFRLGKQPKEPVNALDLLVFPEDKSTVIFRVRKKKDGTEDIVPTKKEYSMFMDEDEDYEDEDEDEYE